MILSLWNNKQFTHQIRKISLEYNKTDINHLKRAYDGQIMMVKFYPGHKFLHPVKQRIFGDWLKPIQINWSLHKLRNIYQVSSDFVVIRQRQSLLMDLIFKQIS